MADEYVEYVPLSPKDCERASQAVRKEAILLLAKGFVVDGLRQESEALRDLANRIEQAGWAMLRHQADQANARVRATGKAAPVDTFPVCAQGDGEARCTAGHQAHPACYAPPMGALVEGAHPGGGVERGSLGRRDEAPLADDLPCGKPADFAAIDSAREARTRRL